MIRLLQISGAISLLCLFLTEIYYLLNYLKYRSIRSASLLFRLEEGYFTVYFVIPGFLLYIISFSVWLNQSKTLKNKRAAYIMYIIIGAVYIFLKIIMHFYVESLVIQFPEIKTLIF